MKWRTMPAIANTLVARSRKLSKADAGGAGGGGVIGGRGGSAGGRIELASEDDCMRNTIPTATTITCQRHTSHRLRNGVVLPQASTLNGSESRSSCTSLPKRYGGKYR
eukprot:6282689-Prymnesium_polylepis.2